MSKTIGQRIKELREQRGLTQDELAKQLGCAQTTVAEWENRKDRLPGGKLLGDIAKIFGISVDYLLNPALKNPQVPCYGEVCCLEFKWPDKANESLLDVPQNEYGSNRFALKISDDMLEPLAYKGDYCIWDKLPPEDGDVVVARFPGKNDLAWIRMWRQDDKSVVLAETGLDKYIICKGTKSSIKPKCIFIIGFRGFALYRKCECAESCKLDEKYSECVPGGILQKKECYYDCGRPGGGRNIKRVPCDADCPKTALFPCK